MGLPYDTLDQVYNKLNPPRMRGGMHVWEEVTLAKFLPALIICMAILPVVFVTHAVHKIAWTRHQDKTNS